MTLKIIFIGACPSKEICSHRVLMEDHFWKHQSRGVAAYSSCCSFLKAQRQVQTSFTLSVTNDVNVILKIVEFDSSLGQKRAFLRWIRKWNEDTQISQSQHPRTESEPALRNQLQVEAYRSPSGTYIMRVIRNITKP